MKKNGFTLIELLAVMAIIVLLFSFGYPAIKNAISYSRTNIKNVQINSILTAAYNYTLEHTNYLPDNNNPTTYISLARLKQFGLVDINIVDPDTEQPFSDDVYVYVQKTMPSADSALIKKEGSYWYTFSYNDTKTAEITLTSGIQDDNTIPAGTNSYSPTSANISSATYDGTSISFDNENVIINVVKDGYMVSSVDTSKVGIYKITYTIEKGNNIVSKVVRVTVNDTTVPTLTIPTSPITHTLGTPYDLNTGVSCTDNSGNCEIIISGDVDTSKAGTYVIKYKARDSFGNTSNVKTLIIKVE